MKEIKALTGLRFMAALYVFLFHLQRHHMLPNFGRLAHNILAQGALGVNVFFLLSGFVLTYSHLNQGAIPLKSFMMRRLIRVAPVYWAGLGITALLTASMHSIPAHLVPLCLLNLTFLESWVPHLAMEWYGGGAWSISVEIFFYALFPLLLHSFNRLGQLATGGWLLGVFVLSCLPGLYFTTHQYLEFAWVYTFPPARLAEFVAGILTALLVFRFGWQVPSWAASGGMVVLLGYLAYFGPRAEGWVVHNWLLLPVAALVVATLSRDYKSPCKWLSSPIMVYFGRLSYGFYIWQIVLLSVFETWAERHAIPQYSWLVSLGFFIVNMVMATLSYELLERRTHTYLTKKLLLVR